nr:hypothetical protein [Tanacetum cinerariifolium]
METLTVESSIRTASSPVPTACLNDSSETSSDARLVSKRVAHQEESPSLENILSLTNRSCSKQTWAHDALLESSSIDPIEILTVDFPIPTVSSPVPTAYSTDSQDPLSDARLISKRVANQEESPSLDNILSLTKRFEDILGVTTNSKESNGVEADISNMETAITASPSPTLRIHKDHPKSQIIGPLDTPIQTRNSK